MNSIAVFARPPVVGRVKTRLSPALPAPLACTLHTAMVADTLAAVRAAHAGRRLLYWSEPPSAEAEALDVSGFDVRRQNGVDLGERLAVAMRELLSEGPPAIIVGTDCPALDAAALDAAMAALERHDVAIGPATDGGYYLIGLRAPAPALFERIAWGTERVFDQTLARARDAGRSVHRLAPLDDVDTPADVAHHIARQVTPAPLPSVRFDAALRAMGLLP